jgi:4'-phosphopantetheinyl transferase EntD
LIVAAAASLPDALAALFGPDVIAESAVPALVDEQLFAEERAYIARAVDTRRAQFGTARVCARRALARLGIAPCALVPSQDRAPQWPAGIRGSIAHTAQQCAVVVTRAGPIMALGLDLESDAPVKAGLASVICTSQERAWLARFDAPTQDWLVPLIFSAKEAFYKCQYPLTSTRLGFTEVELDMNLEAGTFCVADLSDHVPERTRARQIAGRFGRIGRLIVTAAVLES